VIALLHKYGTLQFTIDKAQEQVMQARQCLHGFVPSPALEALHVLADYIVARDV
jgi:geranylgeranyl pyrophosphate synthase